MNPGESHLHDNIHSLLYKILYYILKFLIQILVQYGENRKIIVWKFLKEDIIEKIKKNFSIEDRAAHLLIQKYDKEFEEYVDVDDVDEISGGDKLLVCVPQLSVPVEPTSEYQKTTTKVDIKYITYNITSSNLIHYRCSIFSLFFGIYCILLENINTFSFNLLLCFLNREIV